MNAAGRDTTCRCGHAVHQHHQQDPGWCRICESCKYDPAGRKATGRCPVFTDGVHVSDGVNPCTCGYPAPGREATPACEWCGRALRQVDGAWWAVKGEERGYHPPYCDAADDSRHSPASAGREATPLRPIRCDHSGADHAWDPGAGCPAEQGRQAATERIGSWSDDGSALVPATEARPARPAGAATPATTPSTGSPGGGERPADAGRQTTPLRIGLSIGGPCWWRPRWDRREGRALIGWLFVSLYVELPRRANV